MTATTAGQGLARPPGSVRWWIAERHYRACNTILVQARSRKEAQEKLDRGEGEGTEISYYDIGPAKVVRADKAPNDKLRHSPSEGER